MKKTILIFFLRWAIPCMIIFVFTILPFIVNVSPYGVAQNNNLSPQVFYSIMLIHPFLRAAQIISRNPNFSKESVQTFSKLLKKNFPENVIGEVGYLLIGLTLIVLVLVSIFDRLTTVHYLAIVLYVVSIAMLDIAVAKIGEAS